MFKCHLGKCNVTLYFICLDPGLYFTGEPFLALLGLEISQVNFPFLG